MVSLVTIMSKSKNGGRHTKSFISQRLIILNNITWYQIKDSGLLPFHQIYKLYNFHIHEC